MKTTTFRKNRVATAVSVVLATGFMLPLQAQDNTAAEPAVEIIEVKGIRGSLARSMDVKRESSGVVDAISAEEMGKFPDTNLAESLQRITGVSVSRVNGEGSQITVRGFGPEFNLITLNGRQMPGTGFTRSFNMENLSSEGVSALEVYKTARAENPSGGLGATVNIVTAKPLSSPGQRLSVMGKAVHDSSNEAGKDVTPEFAAVYSNTFADDRFGVAFSFSQARRDFQIQQANVQGWQANVPLPVLDAQNVIDRRPLGADGLPTGNYFFPKDVNYEIADYQRERTNGQLTLQYAATDDLTFTLDYTASRAIVGSQSIGWGIWNNFGANINAYELDERGTAIFADISGDDGSFTAGKGTTEVKAASIGFNMAWQLTDNWQVSFDAHDSNNKPDNGADKGSGNTGQIILGSDQLITKIYDYRTGEIPQAYILWRNGTNELRPSEIDSNFSQFFHSPGESEVQQFQLDSTWYNTVFKIPLVSVKGGVARTDQTMGGTNAWSGLRGGPGFNPSFTFILPDGMFTKRNTGNFLDQFNGGGNGLISNYYYTYSYDEAVARQAAYLTEALLGSNAYLPDPYNPYGTVGQSSVNEVTNSLYLQSAWEFDVANFPVQLNVGARYEKTDVTSSVRQDVEKQVNWVSPSEWIMEYEGGDVNFLTLTGSHNMLLPMMDLRVDLTDDIVSRFSYGKTIARAPLGALGGGRSLSGSPKPGARSGGQGNPNLQPFESTNLDLSLEYYYAPGSYAAIGYFHKSVDNFIGNTITDITIDGLHDILNGPRYQQAVADLVARGEQPTDTAIYNQLLANGHGDASGKIQPSNADPLIVWSISQPQNSDTKKVEGIEAAWQHMIGETGFGFGINGTLVDGDVEFDVDSLTQQSPLVGLSNSANLQLFYEQFGWSIKLTYAWRDSYLIGVGQGQGSSDAPPQFAKAYAQWDLSINKDITENFTVFFEGINLTNETEQGYGRYEEQFLFARQYGPRYIVGARYRF